MHIVIPIHSFEPGGVERVGLRLARRWQSSGHQVTIVLGRDCGASRDDRPCLDYHTLKEPIPTAAWETLWMIFCLCRYLLRNRPDVIFCPGNTYTVVCVAAKLFLRTRCPPVIVKISNDLKRRDMAPPMRAIYQLWVQYQGRLLDRFVAIGAPMRKEALGVLGIEPSRVSWIADPALSRSEIEALHRRRTQLGKRIPCRFLAVGRLVPQKNYSLLIDAFHLHAKPNDTLVIAGEGPSRNALERKARRLGLSKQIEFVGHVSELIKLYHEADVFVLSSDYEGVPAVIIEALVAGLPIAATDCCASMRWLLGDGGFGSLGKPRDPHSLAAAMREAREMCPPQEQMRAVAEGFTLEWSADQYLLTMAECRQDWAVRKFGFLRRKVRLWREGGV